MKLRIATYNVENLFRRAAILNLKDHDRVDELLDQVRILQGLLTQQEYDQALKDKVFEVTQPLVPFIEIRKDAGSLGAWEKKGGVTGFRINKKCNGRNDWTGEITFKAQEFSDQQRKNTGKVIKALDADILCLVEVEGMDVLKNFNNQILRAKKFSQFVMIDSPNDPRGIDVACLTKHQITALKTHVFDAGKKFNPVFSRDCLEVAIDAGLKQPIFVLCNHFKSQSGKSDAERARGAEKRDDQSWRVVEILKAYDLQKQYVVVLGDLNEDSANANQSLKSLFKVEGLTPLVNPDAPMTERYTYFYGNANKGERLNQLDYIFLSEPLRKALTATGFERRGIFDIEKITEKEGAPSQKGFPEITSWDLGASDHAGLWAEFELPVA